MPMQAALRAAVIAVVLLDAVTAYAHAHLDRASPAAGATAATAPTEVALHFTESLESRLSAILVRDAAGKQVDKGNSSVDEKDRALLKVSLPPLAPGTYKVEWRVISVDTHSSKGEYTFRVGR